VTEMDGIQCFGMCCYCVCGVMDNGAMTYLCGAIEWVVWLSWDGMPRMYGRDGWHMLSLSSTYREAAGLSSWRWVSIRIFDWWLIFYANGCNQSNIE